MEHDLSNTAAERAAARWNLHDGVRRYGPAFAPFAAAVGHLVAIRDPDLFKRTFVGTWPSLEAFVSDYIEESGLGRALETLPSQVRPYAVIDQERVAANLREQLLVLDVQRQVWVFDALPVVKTTVRQSEQVVHTYE